MHYQIEWLYSDVNAGENAPDPANFDIHISFLLRFPDIPPGNDHVAHFCLNVLSPEAAKGEAKPCPRRGILVREKFSYTGIVEEVELTVAEAFETHGRVEALQILNQVYIHDDLDFSAEFSDDVKSVDEVLEKIENAFGDVTRNADRVTLHQAVVIDDYGTQAEFDAAGEIDVDTRWQDIPARYIEENAGYLNFVEIDDFKYYLAANMSWSVRNYNEDLSDAAYFTFLKLFPSVAPREIGRGIGEGFDVDKFLEEFSLSRDQANAIYYFLCFMAIIAEFRIGEDQYPAMLGWRRVRAKYA